MEINTIQNKINCQLKVLPPWAAEQREREAIQNDPRLKALIGENMPYTLEKTDGGYLVVTALNNLPVFKVEVKYLPPENCGPGRFELIFPDYIPV